LEEGLKSFGRRLILRRLLKKRIRGTLGGGTHNGLESSHGIRAIRPNLTPFQDWSPDLGEH